MAGFCCLKLYEEMVLHYKKPFACADSLKGSLPQMVQFLIREKESLCVLQQDRTQTPLEDRNRRAVAIVMSQGLLLYFSLRGLLPSIFGFQIDSVIKGSSPL